MEIEKTKLPARIKEYTVLMLLNDIQDSLEEDNEENAVGEKKKREIQYKLVVLQMLLVLELN